MIRRVVGALLYLFPARFRRSFGADMRATFEDRWRECGSWRVAARTITDLVAGAVLERLSGPAAPDQPISRGDHDMTVFWHDFRFALRMLRKSPAFTAVALATLALGIGLNTAMFSVAKRVLWRSFPYADAGSIVWVGEVDGRNPDNFWGISYLNFRDWQARSHSFAQLGARLFDDRTLREGKEPARVSGSAVTPEIFDILGVQPAAGRTFTTLDDRAGATPVILLSDQMWRRRFGADPGMLGRAIHFDDGVFNVVGIMPPQFDYGNAEYWLPLGQVIDPYFVTHRDVWVLNALGRLRAGHTAEAAQSEVEGIARQIRRDHPECNRGFVVRVNPLRNMLGYDLRPALIALLGAVGTVLLITCANLAGLMSVRAAGRAREMAIRSALGAARARMIRQLLTECLTLAILGGGAGIGLAYGATRALAWLSKDQRLLGAAIDVPVLIFACAATLATSLLFGVAPAIHAARTDTAEALQGGARAGAGPRRARVRQLLVIAQVAMSLVLLMGAALLYRSFRRVLDVNPGFRTGQMISMHILLPESYENSSAIVRIDNQFLERLKSLPGVTDATMASSLPVSGGNSTGDLTIEGVASNPGELGAVGFHRTVPGYFHALGIPLVQGRDFSDSDDEAHTNVVIINESMARRFWPGRDPIGRRIEIGPRDTAQWLTIVGVAKDVRQLGLDKDAGFASYQPLAQGTRHGMDVAIRTAGDPRTLIATAQRELRRIEPALVIERVETMSQRIDDSVAPRRLNLVLFGLFSLVALVLAAVGLYGVVAYAAGQRTREFGIRMALGARPADVGRLVLGQGLRLAVVGAAIGMVAALLLTRLLDKLLFGVGTADPVTLVAVAMLLALVALTACWLPAWRATRIMPTQALRAD